MTRMNPQQTTPQPSRRVVILGTGGTIAGSGEQRGANIGYTAGTVPVAELLAGIEAPAGYALVAEQISQLDSKDMDFDTWHTLRLRCAHWLAQPDVVGVVVTHGTDTVEETAYFLHATLTAQKPVVLTCAMRSATSQSPDGPQNLREAIAVATADGASGVVVAAAGEIHGAREVRKEHPYRTNAFGSGDAGPLGYVEEGQVRLVRRWPNGEPLVDADTVARLGDPAVWPRVEIVLSHAGARGGLIDALIRERDEHRPDAVDGIVLAATGNGTLHHTVEQAAQRAQRAGIAVLIATRCAFGQIVRLPDSPLPDAAGLSPVKARIALMLAIRAGIAPAQLIARELEAARR